MHKQLRREIFSIFTSLAFLFQSMLGFFTPNFAYAGPGGGGPPPPNPSADLDQCANGGVGDPAVDCTGSAWQNGNLNQNQAHYSEGDSVPYRMLFGNLSIGAHSVTIEWDTTQGGKHSTDYLASFDETEETANPCFGVGSCGAPDIESIPDDPNATVTQVPGNFTLYNGIITSVSPYTL